MERAIKQQVRSRNYLTLYELKAAEELRTAEMSILTRLEAKYRLPVNHNANATAEIPITVEAPDPQPLVAPVTPVQGSLF